LSINSQDLFHIIAVQFLEKSGEYLDLLGNFEKSSLKLVPINRNAEATTGIMNFFEEVHGFN
jgi:hypothetical protein